MKKKIKIPKKIFNYHGKNNYITKEKYGMSKDDIFKMQDDLWTRALHSDAYKLSE